MRVAFINHHGAVPGGSERSLEVYLRRVPQGIDPFVVLFEDGVYADQLRALNIPVHVVPASRRLMSVTRAELHIGDAFDGTRQVLLVRKLLKSLHIDVVVTNTMKAHVIGAIAAWSCNVRVVSWWHDLPEGLSLWMLRAVSRLCAVERVGCSRAVVRRFALPRTTTLVPPLDLRRFAQAPPREHARALLGLPQDKLIFSIVGRIARWKGQDRFLRAAARVCAGTSNVHFAIVGSATFSQDGEFTPELAELADRLGITNRVSFIPWLDDPRIAYAASDLICNASSAEPFGRTSAEAGACGVPALCFDDGGASEAVLSPVTGMAVPAGNIEAFAAAMMAYAGDAAALRRAGAAARVYVERHDADRLATTFFEVVGRASRMPHPAQPLTVPSAARVAEAPTPVSVKA